MVSFKKIITVIAVCLLVNGFSVYAGAEDGVDAGADESVGESVGESADDVRFVYPLKIPMSLSGDYGELRSNHFHGGIDFRIGGVCGAEVMAAADGCVSRISVSGSGYGNGLYISHPNGYVTVYGHLNNFSAAIEKYVKEQQYNKGSFFVDLYPEPDMFPVKQGEYIANGGNTGSSGGPHLHFEIRDTANVQLNVFAHCFIGVKDKTAPQIREVKFFGVDDRFAFITKAYVPATKIVYVTVKGKKKKRYEPAVTLLPNRFYVGIDAIDRIDGMSAKFAVEKYEVFFDGELVYRFTLGDVPFTHGRYINSLIEYSQKVKHGKMMLKAYCEPGNILKDRIECKEDGIITLPKDGKEHIVKVVVSDFSGNSSSKSYKVKRGADFRSAEPDSVIMHNIAYWNIANTVSASGADIMIPAGSLYSNALVKVDTLSGKTGNYSPIWSIGDANVPLQIPVSVRIKANVPNELKDKALLSAVSSSGKLVGGGGEWKDGAIHTSLYSFGNYTVAVDTIPPVITTSLKNNAVVTGRVLSFKIRDNLSGINDFKAEIDGEWVLYSWDAKTATMSVNLNECGIKPGWHTIVITIPDNKGNIGTLTRKFKK